VAKLKVSLPGTPGRDYDILIEKGILNGVGGLIKPLCPKVGTVAVVTDENVWASWGAVFSSSLKDAGVPFAVTAVPAGEGSKSLQELAGLYDAFAKGGVKRNGLVVAFGGGVVGDLCGFAAATWMRGVRFIQIPTTLLAQVDSSVGGKTAIDLPAGKNLAGAFYQPELVAIDPLVLDTLDARQVKNGMAEVIKYGAIRSAPLFGTLASEKTPDLPGIIHECCRVKSEIVAQDERDTGERALLNFGHTFGHAIESRFGYRRYLHGEAVACGMVLAAEAGERMGLTEPGTAAALTRVLTFHGLDAEYLEDPHALLPFFASDKKNLGDGIQMVFLRRVGEAFSRRVAVAEIGAALGEEA
jgi:3-dehydroquinate synthase